MARMTNLLVVATGAVILIALLTRKTGPDMGILQDKIDALTVITGKVGSEVTAANTEFRSAIASLEAEIARLVEETTVDTTGLESALAQLDAINPDPEPEAPAEG